MEKVYVLLKDMREFIMNKRNKLFILATLIACCGISSTTYSMQKKNRKLVDQSEKNFKTKSLRSWSQWKISINK